jgi:hypothetical protein
MVEHIQHPCVKGVIEGSVQCHTEREWVAIWTSWLFMVGDGSRLTRVFTCWIKGACSRALEPVWSVENSPVAFLAKCEPYHNSSR